METINIEAMKDELLRLLKEKNCRITPEITSLAEQLADCAMAQDNADIKEVLQWLEKKREEYPVATEEIGINQLDKWHADPQTGNISHESGKFFTILGVRVSGAQGREVMSWTQPMVKQNECGILGIICKKIGGVRHFLMYAKYEPGNLHKLQLSPTLQATESNLKQVHGGKKPLFAEYFEESGRGKVLVSVAGVEDGGRFYMKTNRCMLVEVDENEVINPPEDFIWLTLPQVKKLLKIDGIVNSLVREVFGSW